jgi:hypothetical protein
VRRYARGATTATVIEPGWTLVRALGVLRREGRSPCFSSQAPAFTDNDGRGFAPWQLQADDGDPRPDEGRCPPRDGPGPERARSRARAWRGPGSWAMRHRADPHRERRDLPSGGAVVNARTLRSHGGVRGGHGRGSRPFRTHGHAPAPGARAVGPATLRGAWLGRGCDGARSRRGCGDGRTVAQAQVVLWSEANVTELAWRTGPDPDPRTTQPSGTRSPPGQHVRDQTRAGMGRTCGEHSASATVRRLRTTGRRRGRIRDRDPEMNVPTEASRRGRAPRGAGGSGAQRVLLPSGKPAVRAFVGGGAPVWPWTWIPPVFEGLVLPSAARTRTLPLPRLRPRARGPGPDPGRPASPFARRATLT